MLGRCGLRNPWRQSPLLVFLHHPHLLQREKGHLPRLVPSESGKGLPRAAQAANQVLSSGDERWLLLVLLKGKLCIVLLLLIKQVWEPTNDADDWQEEGREGGGGIEASVFTVPLLNSSLFIISASKSSWWKVGCYLTFNCGWGKKRKHPHICISCMMKHLQSELCEYLIKWTASWVFPSVCVHACMAGRKCSSLPLPSASTAFIIII